MGVTISALHVEAHSNVDSKPKMNSTCKLYRLVPYGANDGEWVKLTKLSDKLYLEISCLIKLVHTKKNM